jgi:predicted RNase H-like HicB family nuclease
VAQYVGILDGARDVWGIRFPDFPGCHGGGATPEEALADAISALRELASYYVANGRTVPAPRGMDEVRRDKAAEFDPTCESLVMIPLLLDKARPVRANISIDAGTLEAIDEEAQRRGLTRSSFLASAAVDKIRGSETMPPSGRTGKRWASRGRTGTSLYAVRDEKGQFKDTQTYKKSSEGCDKKPGKGSRNKRRGQMR